MSIFNIYLFVTVAGTGGGIFRYMYSRFLSEAAEITQNRMLIATADQINNCGDMWTKLAAPMKKALEVENPVELLHDLPEKLIKIADEEERVFRELQLCVQS